jgi:hypothetical protein
VVQSLYVGSGGTGGTVGPSNVLYVDALVGSDATGARGNAALPFLTIQAAINAAQAGDTISLAPQSFAIAAPLTIPDTIGRLSIVGSELGGVYWGTTGTQLIGASGVDIFDLGAELGLIKLELSNMYLEPRGTGIAIKGHGDLYAADTFLSEGLALFEVDVWASPAGGMAISLKYAAYFSAELGDLAGDKLFTSCGYGEFIAANLTATVGGGSLRIDYDSADPLASTVGSGIYLRAGTQGVHVVLSGQAAIFCDASSYIVGGLTANLLTGTGPSITWWGTLGTIDFQSTAAKMLPSTATGMTLDFAGCRITGGSALFEVTAPSLAQTVRLNGAVGSAAAQTIRANAGINLVAKDNAFRAPTYVTAGTGTINPGQKTYVVALAGAVQACPLGFTSPVTTYIAQASPDTFATGLVACVGHAATTFNLQSTAGGGNARVLVVWP